MRGGRRTGDSTGDLEYWSLRFRGMVCAVTYINFRIGSNKHKNREEMTFFIIREDINWEKLLSVLGKKWNYAVNEKYYEINT